tara:strand:+ start:22620 stop:23822 length:1203 start_codon:yes stop_codon:yes gene_type:complete
MSHYPLIGQAALMQMMFNGDDLSSTANSLLENARIDPMNAEALLDLSTILLLRGDQSVGLSMQLEALSIRQQFNIQPGSALRLLVLKTPGDFMANSPVEFLIRSADIETDILFIAPDLPYPVTIDHDLVYNGISEGKQNMPALRMAATLLKQWGKPLINRAEEVPLLSRDRACEILDALPGTYMPQNLLLSREEVQLMAATSHQLSEFLVQDRFPILVRPVDSHAGAGLKRLSSQAEILAYLDQETADHFYVAPFVDYRSSDGKFRKYRIAFVKGSPYLCHMAISDNWMIHYLNAGMTESTLKRAEEERAMNHFRQEFGLRHEDALSAVGSAFDLEYFGIDCAESQDGQLLIFEAGNAMVVHDMDPLDMFPYKAPLMQELFVDFQHMLMEKAHPQQADTA